MTYSPTRRQLLHRFAAEAAAVVNTADPGQQDRLEALFIDRYNEERRLSVKNLEASRELLDTLRRTGGVPTAS